MANRIMKQVKSPQAGLILLSGTYSCDKNGRISLGDKKSVFSAQAEDAESATLFIDRYADIMAVYVTAQGAEPLITQAFLDLVDGKVAIQVDLYKVESGALVPNDDSYAAHVTIIAKNTKVRP